jgi:CelD/BcsL family acetyltransferase involved in cellulose biosynthesis
MLKGSLVESFTELENLGSEWDRLWQISPRSEVFGRRDWLRAWWRAYGRERKLCAAVVRRKEKIIGIWPLCRAGRVVTALGMPRSDYNDMLCEGSDAPEVFRSSLEALVALSPGWARLEIENVPEDSALALAASDISDAPDSRVFLEKGQECSKVCAGGEDRDFLEQLTSNKHLRRKEHRLSRFGPISFIHLTKREDIFEHLPDFFEQHIGRRELAGEKSMFLVQRERDFYRYLVEEMDPEKTLRFAVLKAGDVTLGYHLGFETNGKYLCYKPTFNSEYSKWSPGEVLFRNIFEYVAERGLSECDFTVGAEGFKERFANARGHNYELKVFNASFAGAVEKGVDQAKAMIKKRPWLYSAVNSVRKLQEN